MNLSERFHTRTPADPALRGLFSPQVQGEKWSMRDLASTLRSPRQGWAERGAVTSTPSSMRQHGNQGFADTMRTTVSDLGFLDTTRRARADELPAFGSMFATGGGGARVADADAAIAEARRLVQAGQLDATWGGMSAQRLIRQGKLTVPVMGPMAAPSAAAATAPAADTVARVLADAAPVISAQVERDLIGLHGTLASMAGPERLVALTHAVDARAASGVGVSSVDTLFQAVIAHADESAVRAVRDGIAHATTETAAAVAAARVVSAAAPTVAHVAAPVVAPVVEQAARLLTRMAPAAEHVAPAAARGVVEIVSHVGATPLMSMRAGIIDSLALLARFR